jgi:hypothetical protein
LELCSPRIRHHLSTDTLFRWLLSPYFSPELTINRVVLIEVEH